MKKYLLSAILLITLTLPGFTAVAPVSETPVNPKASELFLPIGNTGNKISLQDLSTVSRVEFEKLSGHKMKGVQKTAFKMMQKKLRNMINEKGEVKNKTLKKAALAADNGGGGFHIGGFALGFLLGLIGVLIAYLIND